MLWGGGWAWQSAPASPAQDRFSPTPIPYTHVTPQGGEDDIDALLAQFKLMDAENNAVKVLEDVRVSPRVYGSFTLIPSQVCACVCVCVMWRVGMGWLRGTTSISVVMLRITERPGHCCCLSPAHSGDGHLHTF